MFSFHFFIFIIKHVKVNVFFRKRKFFSQKKVYVIKHSFEEADKKQECILSLP